MRTSICMYHCSIICTYTLYENINRMSGIFLKVKLKLVQLTSCQSPIAEMMLNRTLPLTM